MWKEKLFKLLADSGIEFGVLIGGIWGAFSSLWSKSIENWWVGVLTFFSGTGSAVYLTMIFKSLVVLNSEAYYGVSFVFGLAGLRGAELMFKVLQIGVRSKIQ